MQHMNNGRRDDGVVHRQVDEAHAELKLGEEGDGEGTVGRHGVWLLGHVHHPQGWRRKHTQFIVLPAHGERNRFSFHHARTILSEVTQERGYSKYISRWVDMLFIFLY